VNPNNELLQAAKAAADQLMAIGVSEKSHDIAVDLRTAIARAEASASQPAPDDEREKAIESWRTDARLALPLYTHDGKHTLREHHLIPRAVALMRSAPLPAPAVPSDAEIEAFLPPFDHCVSARDVAQQLGFELKDGYLSPKDQAIVEHAAACIEDLMRRAPYYL
jgi:hypothetical protein